MLLSIAFSANIGGTATLIGTPPNLVMYEYINKYPGHPVTFGSWMLLCVPLMVVNLALAWLWLQLIYLPLPFCAQKKRGSSDGDTEIADTGDNITRLLRTRYEELGGMTRHEKSVLSLFLVLVMLWMTRAPGFVSGWGVLVPPGVADATPALLIALIMFVVPVSEDGSPMLTWPLVQSRLAWGVIILLGGGFALAEVGQVFFSVTQNLARYSAGG